MSGREGKPKYCCHVKTKPTGHGYTKRMAGSLSIFITPQCYKITRQYLPRDREGGMLCTRPRKLPVITRSGPSFFKPSRASLSSPSPRVRSQAVADIVNQQLAAFLPAHSPGSSCVFLPLVPCVASSPFPSLLVSAFQPSQVECVPNPWEETPCLIPNSPLWVSRFFSLPVRFSPDP